MTHSYLISGMTCGNCVSKVKSELLKNGDIEEAAIQLAAPQAIIRMSRHISTDTLQSIISKAGAYTIREADAGMHAMSAEQTEPDSSGTTYFPIFLLFGYITMTSLLVQAAQGSFNTMEWMRHFMAGFFLVFSFFKLLNLKGFAEGYSMYDVVAKRWSAWGFIYPFVELGLGIAFLLNAAPLITNIITLLVMGISTIGVIQNLARKSPFQCACLGTIFKIPLSKVTLVEDLLMVGMSGWMISQLA